MRRFPMALFPCLVALCAAASVDAGEIPKLFKELVPNSRARPRSTAVLGGLAFDALSLSPPQPLLLWPSDALAAPPFERTPEAARDWLQANGAALGLAEFELRFEQVGSFRTAETWDYAFEHRGVSIDRRRLRLYFEGDRWLGIQNEMPAPIRRVEEPGPARAGAERVYLALRDGDVIDLVVAPVAIEETDDWIKRITYPPNALPIEHWTPRSARIGGDSTEFKEFVVPSASFPDQLGVDSHGTVWISQPNNDRLLEFVPATETFKLHATGGSSGPDGLFVDSHDRVWTGLYYSGALGWLDPLRHMFHTMRAPYGAGAAMAIPVEHSSGTIWVTDHQSNRISEFDVRQQRWAQSLIMPTAACWVVQGAEDLKTGDLWFTEYNVNQLGVKRAGGPIQDVSVPGGGPAFLGLVGRKVYYSEWNDDRLGEYDLETHTIREYDFPITGEVGGPMWPMPDGRVVVGTRNRGYIMIFSPSTQTFTSHQIPTAFPGLKDGLFVDKKGIIWFTESGAGKLARLDPR